MAFGDKTAIGKTGVVRTVTIKNDGKKKTGLAVTIDRESASPSVFTVKSPCETTLAPGKSCKVSITFTPTETKESIGNLKIYDDADGSPQSIGLSGTGKAVKTKK